MSVHSSVFGVGTVKMAAKVFFCPLFMEYSGILWWHFQEENRFLLLKMTMADSNNLLATV